MPVYYWVVDSRDAVSQISSTSTKSFLLVLANGLISALVFVSVQTVCEYVLGVSLVRNQVDDFFL